jgi:hypothetical protein
VSHPLLVFAGRKGRIHRDWEDGPAVLSSVIGDCPFVHSVPCAKIDQLQCRTGYVALWIARWTHTHPLVPIAIGASLVQASIYDVPGGYRAVLFDRFSGVQPNVSDRNLAACVSHLSACSASNGHTRSSRSHIWPKPFFSRIQ